MKKKRILMIGPFPPPFFGQSISNQVLYKNLKKTCDIVKIDTNREKLSSKKAGKFTKKVIIDSIIDYIRFIINVFRVKNVYITLSQSKFGFMKHSFFIYVSKFFKKNVVLHFKGNNVYNVYKAGTFRFKKFIKKTIEKADYNIALTERLKSELYEISDKASFEIIDNFCEEEFKIDNNEYICKRRAFERKNILKILYLSNIFESKGIFELIDAVKNDPNYFLTIAGKIDDDIENLFYDKLKNIKNIEYVGIVSGNKKREVLLKNHIFCLPTEYPIEGQPISIIEALNMGCIVLSTYYKGIPDTLPIAYKKNSFFIKKNSTSIKEKLDSLFRDRSLIDTLTTENLQNIQKRFSEKKFTQSIRKLFI